MTKARLATDRAVLRISGADHAKFLQDLVTNDLAGLEQGLVYAALLTPQGKYLFDFLLAFDGDGILIDVASDRAPALVQRLNMYKLRADVTVTATDMAVVQLWGDPPAGAMPDPRAPQLGHRMFTPDPAALTAAHDVLSDDDWTALRIAFLVPESGVELIADDSYILEAGFERLNGVDFKKGCYVGQEVTARMKHKTALKKGLVQVSVDGTAPPPGTAVLAGEKVAGTLYSTATGTGLAHLRFDRATGEMSAGDATLRMMS